MADNMRMQAEMRELQAQIAQLKNSLTSQGYSVADEVRHRTSAAARQAEHAAKYARDEAATVAGIVREHPTAASTALLGMALVGGLVGYLLGSQQPDHRRRWYQY